MNLSKRINKGSKRELFICVIAALISVAFCAVVWAIIGISPWGNRTLLNSDMESQYVAFFESLRSVISGENSIFYNWSLYLGNNYLGHYAYYLASPWSWFLLLWKTEELPTAIYFMSLIKIGLCGFTFSYFLLRRPIHNYVIVEGQDKKYYIGVVAFSVCYALMNYNTLYVNTPMWIDSVYMLPLVMLGLERIVVGKKSILYYVSFTLTIIFNFYTAFMVALFSIIYFVYYWFYSKSWLKLHESEFKVTIKAFLRYVFTSFAAVGSSLVLLLPTVYCLGQGKLEDETNYFIGKFTYPIWQILLRFFDSSYTSVTNEGLPSVFCTSFCIVFTVFFIVMGLKKSSKICAICISIFWVISLWVVPINRIWTGFRDPIWFPFRYAFVISFFFVLLGFEGFVTFNGWKFKFKRPFYILWAILTVFELYLCINNPRVGIIREIGAATDTVWEAAADKYVPLILEAESLENADAVESTGFYRIDKDEFFTFNDAMLYKYHGVQSFSSVFNKNTLVFLKNLGLKQDDYELYEKGNSIVSDSLIGVKYFISHRCSNAYYQELEEIRTYRLYENPYALSLGFMTDATADNIEWSGSPFENQNAILSTMLNRDVKAYSSIEVEESVISYQDIKDSIDPGAYKPTELSYSGLEQRRLVFNVPESGHVYVYAGFDVGNHDDITRIYNESKQIYVNGRNFDSFIFGGYTYVMDIGYYDKGAEVSVIVTNCSANACIYVAQEDSRAITEALADLNNNAQMTDITIDNGNMTGTISAASSGRLFMSIPYDKGWTLYVDGVETNITVMLDTFCSADIEAGSHTIEMKYVSPYFKEGLLVSIVSILLYSIVQVVIALMQKRVKKD